MRIAQADGDAKRHAALQGERTATEKKHAAERDSLTAQVSNAAKEYQEASRAWGQTGASDALIELDVEASKLLDEVGEFERQIKLQAAIEQRAEVDFAKKAKDFNDASKHHEKRAIVMLLIMGLLTGCGALFIYDVFFDPQLTLPVLGYSSESPTGQPPTGQSPTGQMLLSQLAFLSVGRLAVLFFFAWALKYTGSLHTSHSAQAIIYRDRAAALGIADNLMKSAPDLEKRQDLLQTLARGYLDFEQNAFNQAGKHRGPDTKANLEISEAIAALKPLLDALRPFIVNRPKPEDK
jgi:hypothetical protein